MYTGFEAKVLERERSTHCGADVSIWMTATCALLWFPLVQSSKEQEARSRWAAKLSRAELNRGLGEHHTKLFTLIRLFLVESIWESSTYVERYQHLQGSANAKRSKLP